MAGNSLKRCISRCLPLAVAFAAAAGAALGQTEPQERIVRVGVLTDNFPYSFRAEGGRIEGFAYELVAEVERTMGLKFERVEGTTEEITRAFTEGRVDMLQSLAHFPERDSMADFSVPYVTMAGAIFVRDTEQGVRRLADLRGKRVLVHRGSLGENALRRAGLESSIVHVQSVEEALRQLDRGVGDATLASRLTGMALSHHLDLRRLRALPVAVEGYADVRYCLAVQNGDSTLLARLNEGLAIVVRTGRFEELYAKWFRHIEPRRYSAEEVLLAVAVGLLLALVVAVWAGVKQRAMRRRLARQAAELRASEERYRGLFEGAHDGLLVLGADGQGGWRIEQCNPAARRLLQTGSGPEPGTRLARVLGGDSALVERLGAAARAAAPVEFEHEKPGAAGWWRVVVSPLGDQVLVSLADITEQVQARLSLQRRDEQMRHTQKLEAIGTLAGGIAHDFNNLLTAILGNTQLTLMGLPPAHLERESLEQVLKAGQRAQQLVRQILAFSRRGEASRQPVHLAPLVEEVIAFLRAVARGTVEFSHRPAPGEVRMLADPAQVHQALMNIGTNALQAMRGAAGRLIFTEEVVTVDAGADVQLAGLRPGHYLRLAVEDNGPGMTREIRERIFEPFFTTKPLGEGTGLGLSVVHGVMQGHGGAVTVHSEPGRGTCFHLYFPLAADGAGARPEDRIASVPRGTGQRLLFVDDDMAIVETARKILLHLGYGVSAHLRPDEALAELEASPDRFALVISDLTMPGLNGLQFAAKVRQLRPDMPLVLVSGYWTEADMAEARRLRVSATLHKPLTVELLGHAAAAQLRTD